MPTDAARPDIYFVDPHQTDCIPSEETYDAQVNGIKGTASQGRWCTIPDVMGQLKRRAKEKGLWNLFLSRKAGYKEGVDLTNLEVRLPPLLV